MTRSSYTTRIAFFALLAILLLAAGAMAGCGGSSGTSSDSGSTSTEPIKMGVPVALSGFFAGDGKNSLQGIQYAVDQLNAAGGVLGRKVEMETFDVQDMAPERLMLAASTLVEQKKCDVIVGGYVGNGPEALAFGKYGVPFFNDSATDAQAELIQKNGFTNVFTTCNLNSQLVSTSWQNMTSVPYQWPNKKVALMFGQDSLSDSMRAQMASEAEKSGWQVVLNKAVPYGSTDFTPYLTTIRAEQPSLILFWVYSPTDQVKFMKAFLQDPTNSVIDMDGATTVKEFLDLGGAKNSGIVGVAQYCQQFGIQPPSQAAQDWVDGFTKSVGNPPAGLAAMTQISVTMWAKAVEAVGDPTKYAEINDWLAKNKVTVWDGIPPYYFASNFSFDVNDLPIVFGQIQDSTLTSTTMGGQPYKDYQGNSATFQTPPWVK